MSQHFTSGGQSIGASASASVLPVNSQDLFPLGSTAVLEVQGTLKSLIQHHSSKASILQHSVFFIVQLLHPYMTTGKTIALTTQTFVGKVTCLLFNMLSRFMIAFLPRSNHLTICISYYTCLKELQSTLKNVHVRSKANLNCWRDGRWISSMASF